MQYGESSVCPVCNASFICNRLDVVNCHCYQVQLSGEERKQLTGMPGACLCTGCLQNFRVPEKGTIVEENNGYTK